MPDQNDGGSPGQNYSNFPNGIRVNGYGTAPASLYPGLYGTDYLLAVGTAIVPSGAGGTTIVPTVGGQALGSAVFAIATPYGDLGAGTAFVDAFAKPGAGGSVTFLGVNGAGGASSANGTIAYMVVGTY